MPARFRQAALLIMIIPAISPLTTAPAQEPLQKEAVIAYQKHAVVAREPFAAEAGRLILNQGGNAIDAAVATALALQVTHPPAGNIGGGGFIVHYSEKEQRATTFDFREKAPLAATEKMYLDDQGKIRPGHRRGPWAAGVPGTVRGLALAHKKLGRLPWAKLVEPAEKLAREGFPLNPVMAASLNAELFGRSNPDPGTKIAENLSDADRLADFPESVRVYARADHQPWKAGDRLIQPDLADTFKRLQEEGPDEFYTGKTARLMAEYSQKNGGLITMADLAAYQAVEREPVRITYKGHEVIGMGPPSSGGIINAIALNLLEPLGLRQYGRTSAETAHLAGEALRRGFYQRFRTIGDPDFVDVPVARLVSKEFAKSISGDLSLERTTPSVPLADFPVLPPESTETTHFSVIDGEGNAVALTYTLEESYGAKCVVPGAGFLLNNEMGDFNLVPGRTTTAGQIGTKPNLIAPGKRMVSSMSPTVVVKDGRVKLVTGSPGGRTIPSTVLWMILGAIEFELEPEMQQKSPKLYQTWLPDVITVEKAWPKAAIEGLKSRGWRVVSVSAQGDAHSILVDSKKNLIFSLPDKRRGEGAAAGD